MKNIIFKLSFLLLFLLATPLTYAKSVDEMPAEGSEEELVMDMFFSLLLPSIQEAVSYYYSAYLTESPLVYPYEINILKMAKVNESFQFTITVEVMPVLGAHNPVGKDHLAFSITPSNIKLLQFQHVETYELLEHLQQFIKNKN